MDSAPRNGIAAAAGADFQLRADLQGCARISSLGSCQADSGIRRCDLCLSRCSLSGVSLAYSQLLRDTEAQRAELWKLSRELPGHSDTE